MLAPLDLPRRYLVGFNPLEFLKERTAPGHPAAWLDLCCGTGKALIQAARVIGAEGMDNEIVGVDLVGMFAPTDSSLSCTLDDSRIKRNRGRCFPSCRPRLSVRPLSTLPLVR